MSDATNPTAPEAVQVPVASESPAVDEKDVAASPQEGAGEQPPDEQSGEGEDQNKKPRQKASERIGELYGRMKSAERERDAALAELGRLRTPVVDPAQWDQLSFDQQQQVQMRQVIREERAQEIEQAAMARDNEARAARQVMFQERFSSFVERVPEASVAMTDPTLPVSEVAARFISESDKGPEVLFWLHQNRQDATRIARMDPVSQAFELGRVEARISAAPAARKISNAPAPVPKVGGGAGAGAKDPTAMTMSEYAEWYRKRGA